MSDYKLKALTRDISGKKVKSLRRQELVPAVIYSSPTDVRIISVNERDLDKIISKAGATSLIDIEIEGIKESQAVLINEVQYNQRSLKPMHVSFHKVNLNEEVDTDVPIELVGEAPAIKAFGGILINSISELTIRSLPTNIPHEITINVSHLENIGDGILIKDIILPEGVKLLHADEETLEQTIVTVAPPQKEEVEIQPEIAPEDIELSVEKGKTEETEETSSEHSEEK